MGISDWSSDVCSSDLIRACATIPLHVIVAQARIGKSLLAADEVRKLHRVEHEEDRRVVADQIVVALVGVELQREAAHVAPGIRAANPARDGRKARQHLGTVPLMEHSSTGVGRDTSGTSKTTTHAADTDARD